jgi:hypothetical protein
METEREKEVTAQGVLVAAIAAFIITAFTSGCSFQVSTEYWGKTGIHNTSASAYAHGDGDEENVRKAKY